MTDIPIQCPNCEGRGRIRQFITYSAYPNPSGLRRPIFFDVTCVYCHGNGFLRPGSEKARKVSKR